MVYLKLLISLFLLFSLAFPLILLFTTKQCLKHDCFYVLKVFKKKLKIYILFLLQINFILFCFLYSFNILILKIKI
jgi:hypothetical protein